MTGLRKWCRWQDQHLVLTLSVQPRGKRDEIVGPGDGHLKVRICAQPVAGKANDRLQRFLADEFGVPQSYVELLKGAGTRVKRGRIRDPNKLPRAVRLLVDEICDPHSK